MFLHTVFSSKEHETCTLSGKIRMKQFQQVSFANIELFVTYQIIFAPNYKKFFQFVFEFQNFWQIHLIEKWFFSSLIDTHLAL